MKLSTVFLFLITSSQWVVGQSLQMELGPAIDAKELSKQVDVSNTGTVTSSRDSDHSTSLLFDREEKKTYAGLGLQDKAFSFLQLDNYLNYSAVRKLASDKINEAAHLHAFITLDDKMYVFYSVKYPKQDQFTLYANQVTTGMVILGTPIVLSDFKELKNYGMNLRLSSSADKKFVLITRVLEPKSKETQKLDCRMMNDALKEVWTKRIETEIMGKEHSIQSIRVDNHGNLYALTEFQNGRTPKQVVYTYFWKASSLKSLEPGLATGVNFGTRIEILNGNQPYLMGLNEGEKTIKYFLDRINIQSQTMDKLGSAAMPADFARVSDANIFQTRQWAVMDIITTENEAIIASIEAVVLEAKYGVQHSYDAFVLAFRRDGSAIWSRTIHKKQTTMPGMAGHILVPAQNNVLVLYNDDAENITKTTEDSGVALFNSNNAMAVVQEIDVAGKASKYQLTANKEFEGFAINLNAWGKIEDGLYFNAAVKINRNSTQSRNATLRVVK